MRDSGVGGFSDDRREFFIFIFVLGFAVLLVLRLVVLWLLVSR